MVNQHRVACAIFYPASKFLLVRLQENRVRKRWDKFPKPLSVASVAVLAMCVIQPFSVRIVPGVVQIIFRLACIKYAAEGDDTEDEADKVELTHHFL